VKPSGLDADVPPPGPDEDAGGDVVVAPDQRTVYIAGQVAQDSTGALLGGSDFRAQAEQAFANLRRTLEAAGSSLDKIVKVTIYLTDMSNFPKIVELRGRHFTEPWPADTIVGVTALALPELEIEIEAIALADGEVLA